MSLLNFPASLRDLKLFSSAIYKMVVGDVLKHMGALGDVFKKSLFGGTLKSKKVSFKIP